MKLDGYSHKNVQILRLTGRFDAHTVPEVSEWLAQATAVSNPQVVINLAHVNFIDSAGLALLLNTTKSIRSRGGILRLCALQQPVRIIFELTRFDQVLDIYHDEPAALADQLPIPPQPEAA